MFDLDDFKRVNDVYGHGAGDQLLIQLARLARETVRDSDVVCRIGGEEFGVIMPSCDAGDALGLAARLTERLSEVEFEPAGRMTVSIGISQGPQHAMNPRELIACAESAMMAAKARGKNQTVLYDDGPTERPAAGADRRRPRCALGRAPEDAAVTRGEAQPAERRPADRTDDRNRASAVDRLPQLPCRAARRRPVAADHVRR